MNIKNTKIQSKQIYLVICLIAIWLVLIIASFIVYQDNSQIIIENFTDSSALTTVNSCTNQAKTQGEINIATYNIGDDTDECEKCDPADRMKALFDLMNRNHVDIIALQEVWIRRNGSPELLDDLESLLPLLGNNYNYVYRGHSDDNLTSKGIPNQGSGYGNMIVTKLPIRNASYKEYLLDRVVGDGEGQRYLFSVIVDTPQGPLRIYNIHTRAKESAWGVTEAAKFLKSLVSTEPSMPLIVLGDFNQGIGYIQSQLGDTQYGLNINFGCSNSAVCFGGGIDLIFPNDKTLILNRCRGSAESNGLKISGRHVPVYATFKLLNPITPTPTATPTPPPTPVLQVTPIVVVSQIPSLTSTANPTILPPTTIQTTSIPSPAATLNQNDKAKYDLYADDEIDINDFAVFVNFYKTSNCRIDYNVNNNCRDIEDFYIFVNDYKKYQD